MNKKLRAFLIDLVSYGSVLFLLVYLIRKDAFSLGTEGIEWSYIFLSLIFLLGGFLLNAFSWMRILRLFGADTEYKTALYSLSKTIFTKYIPGKIWIVISRASVVAHTGVPFNTAAFASSLAQITTICTGLGIGFIFLFKYGESVTITASTAIVIVMLAGFLGLKSLQKGMFQFMKKLTRQQGEFIDYPVSKLLKAVLFFIMMWFSWGTGFYLLVRAFTPEPGSFFFAVCIFAMASTVGIVSLLMPGGLGVREGIIVGLLVLMGVPATIAASISIASRVWFFAGELTVFITSFFLMRDPKTLAIRKEDVF